MTSKANPIVEFHEVERERWPDLVRLMEGRGGPKHCWCLVWREPSKARREMDLEARRAAMGARVAAGSPIGILGYVNGEPVAWCSVAPRDTYLDLGGEDYGPGVSVWSVVCFFLLRRVRRMGVGAQALRAAIDLAKSRGAHVVEGYPVEPESPSYRFMGFVPMFREAGFEEIGMIGSRRHGMRLILDRSAVPD